MGKLRKQNKIYLSILYIIWELLWYYADFFSLEVPNDPTKLSVKLSYYEDNLTQRHIFEKQKDLILNHNSMFVLNTALFFYVDFFGRELFQTFISHFYKFIVTPIDGDTEP